MRSELIGVKIKCIHLIVHRFFSSSSPMCSLLLVTNSFLKPYWNVILLLQRKAQPWVIVVLEHVENLNTEMVTNAVPH